MYSSRERTFAGSRIRDETVLGFLKMKLPPQRASQIDSVVGGIGAAGTGNIGELAKSLGGVLGKK